MKSIIRLIKNALFLVPPAPVKTPTKQEKEKREQEIINKINQRIAMRDNC